MSKADELKAQIDMPKYDIFANTEKPYSGVLLVQVFQFRQRSDTK